MEGAIDAEIHRARGVARATSVADLEPPPIPAAHARRWRIEARLAKLARVRMHATRAVGLATALAKSGPATGKPWFHRALRAIGVLERDTESAVESPMLAVLPWGSKTVKAPQPERPAGVDGMWPQAPVFDEHLYPAVLHLARGEIEDHVRTNMLRYLGQIVTLTPGAALRARFTPRVRPLDDATFAAILTETSLAQHLRHALDPADLDAFASVIDGELDACSKTDFSGVRPGPALPWVKLTPSVTLFRRRDDGTYEPRAIRFGDVVITPADGEAWVLARYHALSGVHIQHTVIIHPRIHFPSDVVNVVTKSVLPPEHPLARLLLPHTRFSLGLDLAVTHHRRSVLWSSQREIYTALPLETEGICAAVRLGREGREGVAYPAYDFWGIPHDPRTAFGRYCAEWEEAFVALARAITERIPARDADVARWADAIAEWVPGFPDARAIAQGDTLARAVGRYLASVTVLHSADHHSYAGIPIEHLPMRLLRDAPRGRDEAPVDLDALVGVDDFFRHVLNHAMFFRPVVAESLDEVSYAFDGDAERAAIARFRCEQQRIDLRWRGSGFPASYEIASSIQY